MVLIGMPNDENSSYLRWAAAAPQKIREALHCGSANLCNESGPNLGNQDFFIDLGDLELEGLPAPLEAVDLFAAQLLERQVWILSLGGSYRYEIVAARYWIGLDFSGPLYISFEKEMFQLIFIYIPFSFLEYALLSILWLFLVFS